VIATWEEQQQQAHAPHTQEQLFIFENSILVRIHYQINIKTLQHEQNAIRKLFHSLGLNVIIYYWTPYTIFRCTSIL
jgi:hypothetical protein